MAESYRMRQCVLLRKEDRQFVRYTAWIPANHAIMGRLVKIKDMGQWMVDSVGSEDSSENVIANSNDYRRYRQATDI